MIPNFIKILQNMLGVVHTITTSPDDKFDFQINVNKLVGKSELDQLIDLLNSTDEFTNIFTFEKVNAGKGNFLCFAIKPKVMTEVLQKCHINHSVNFVQSNSNSKTIIYDYSSPNMSKDMHVGHLRSTIIGDTLANVSEYLGNNVIRLNHIGDFGLPFGMIVEYVIQTNETGNNLQQIYIESKKMFDTDKNFSENAYKRTALLQNKTDDQTNIVWTDILNKSLAQYQHIYKLLNISPNLKIKGESFYVDYIDDCKKLLENEKMINVDDDGRIMVKCSSSFNPLTYIKSGEKGCAYTYDTTDIVALWFRTCVMKADEIYYVVDNRQSLHFEQVFNVGKNMGWLNENKRAVHIQFGTILGKDGKPLQSRNGGAPRLVDLIDESVEKTTDQFKLKGKDIREFSYEINALAIGSLKYQDYSKCRTSDYKFNSDQMLKFDGSTYTFLSYTVSRIRGIMDHVRTNDLTELLNSHVICLDELSELDFKVIKKLVCFSQVIETVEETKMIHGFIDFLSKLCVAFNSNYTNSRYLNFDEDGKLISCNLSKLIMCKVVLDILSKSCELLGLQLVNEM